MNDSLWQKLLLAAFCVCFVCLFVTGAERLIADEEPADQTPARVFSACIVGVQDIRSEAEKLFQREHDAGKREERCAGDSVRMGCPFVALCRDANGNILSCRSYLHAVYQAFALGDGFV